MRALLKFFKYNKIIAIIVTFLCLITYVFLGLIYDKSLEIKLAIYFTFIISIICINNFIRQIKINNFERFLSTSPIGRKSVLKTLNLINILISFIIPILFYIFNKIRINFIPIIDNATFVSNFELPNIMFLVLIGVNLVISMFSIIILLNDNNSNLLKLKSSYILFVFLFLIISFLFIYKFNIFTFNIRALTFTILCFIFYIFLYFLNLKVYLKSDL